MKAFKFESNLHQKSIIDGLIPPDDQVDVTIKDCGCVNTFCKENSPSFAELELSERSHRDKGMNKIIDDYSMALIGKTTEYEVQWIDLFGLPPIDAVRDSSRWDDYQKTFTYTDTQIRQFRELIDVWEVDIIGEERIPEKKLDQDDFPDVEFYMSSGFLYWLDKVDEEIIKNAPPVFASSIITGLNTTPQNNPFYEQVITNTVDRVDDQLANVAKKELVRDIKKIARESGSIMDVARKMHNTSGEGKAWWWRRLARSESTLITNAAFNFDTARNNTPLQQWSATGNACPICTFFDGKVWPVGQGPEPVTNTHPHCLCVLIPLYRTATGIQQPWTRPSPYQQRYSQDELQAFRDGRRFQTVVPGRV